MTIKISKVAKAKADQYFQEGVNFYRQWDIELAIKSFEAAIILDNTDADYYLYLAQAYVRLGDYNAMRRALGRFIQFETNLAIAERYEALFGSALDAVELALTEVMSQHGAPLEVIGAAIQMWVDFRVAWGRQSLNIAGLKPKVWAAAHDYTVRKINFYEKTYEELAQWYGVSAEAIMQHHKLLLQALDIMPCDYRYFRGPENPLDKLVEAAVELEELEERFYSE